MTSFNKAILFCSVSLTAFGLVHSSASAGAFGNSEVKPYVSLFGGASVLAHPMHADFTSSSGPFYYGSGDFSTKTGYIIGGAFGARWNDHLRTEIELSHSNWKLDRVNAYIGSPGYHITGPADGSVYATYLLGNVWYDFKNTSRLTPYLGGGVGVGWASFDLTSSFISSSPGFAFQVGGGLTYDVNEHLALDVGYRFKDLVGLNFNSAPSGSGTYTVTNTSLQSHNFQAGLTYNF